MGEQQKAGSRRPMSMVLWDTFTGSAPYRDILMRTLHPAFFLRFLWENIVGGAIELRYLPPAEVDLARLELWARQIIVDASAQDLGGITGDVATMEWIRDRFTQILDPADLTRIDAHLIELQGSVADKDSAAAADEAASLRDTLAGLTPTS